MAKKKKPEKQHKHICQNMIEHFQTQLETIDIKIMTHVFTVVLLITVIAATVAWFTMSASAKISGLSLQSAGIQSFAIMKTENGEDIGEDCRNGEELTVPVSADTEGTEKEKIEIRMAAFDNLFNKKGEKIETENSCILAPGSYGSFTFYVKSLGGTQNAELTLSKVLDIAVNEEDTQGAESDRQWTAQQFKKQIECLFEGHILCFAVEKKSAEATGTTTPVWTEVSKYCTETNFISKDKGISLSFTEDEVKKITVYWVWPYEYSYLIGEKMQQSGEKMLSLPTNIEANRLTDSGTSNAETSAAEGGAGKKIFALPDINYMPNKIGMPDSSQESSSEADFGANENSWLALAQIFEWQQYNDSIADYKDSAAIQDFREQLLIEWYDYADTLIGQYISQMVFHISVKGVSVSGEA